MHGSMVMRGLGSDFKRGASARRFKSLLRQGLKYFDTDFVFLSIVCYNLCFMIASREH